MKQSLLLFQANAEGEERNGEDADENYVDHYNDDVDSQSDGYIGAEDQDLRDLEYFKLDEFLTSGVYVGNLHCDANCYQVKKAIHEGICLKAVPIVDQVVIATTIVLN